MIFFIKAPVNLVKVTLKWLICLTFCIDHCFHLILTNSQGEKYSMVFSTVCSSKSRCIHNAEVEVDDCDVMTDINI